MENDSYRLSRRGKEALNMLPGCYVRITRARAREKELEQEAGYMLTMKIKERWWAPNNTEERILRS